MADVTTAYAHTGCPMTRLIASTLTALALLPVSVSAQSHTSHHNSGSPIQSTTIAVDSAALPIVVDAARQTPGARRRADRLWNGVLIGAGLGAISGVVVGSAIVECSECAGFNVPLTFGALGGGIGGALGALIDAAHARPQIASPLPRYVRLSPAMSKRMLGLTATVVF